MNGEERKAYIATVLIANPEYLERLATKTLHLGGHQQCYIHNSSGLFVNFGKIFVCENCGNTFTGLIE